MEKVIKLLAEIGLREGEIKVYLACLELGSASVVELAQKTRIPRATIYLLIDFLLKKGLLSQSALGKRKRFLAEPPEKLLHLAWENKAKAEKVLKEIKQELPQFSALYNLKVQKPKVRYYESVEGVKEIYEDSLNYPEILVHCMAQEAIKMMGGYLESYFKRVLRRQITTREIVSDTPLDKDYQEKYSTRRNQIVCIPQKYVTSTDYFIYGEKIAFITYKGGQPIGILIEDQELVRHERVHFEVLWRAAQAKIL